MSTAQHRHDLTDRQWALIEPHLPGRTGQWGGVARDHRRFVNAVLWILRTGAPWRDRGIWEGLLEILIDEPDFEWLMIDASHGKTHASANCAIGGNDGIGSPKADSTPSCTWPWMRMVCRSESLQRKVPERIVQKLTS